MTVYYNDNNGAACEALQPREGRVNPHGRLILSLCDYSGVWSQPYVDAGYEVTRIDLAYGEAMRLIGPGVWEIGGDILTMNFSRANEYHGILAAPPCTCFCRPGARWWSRQDASGQTQRDILLFRTCMQICQQSASWWALENPPGRHRTLMPELPLPSWSFQPWEYGDPWCKQTYIWGTAAKPMPRCPVVPEPSRRTPNGKLQGRIARLSSTAKRMRAETPKGFAAAFFEANP